MRHALDCASRIAHTDCDCPARDYAKAQMDVRRYMANRQSVPTERELIAKVLDAQQKYADATMDLVTLLLTSEVRR